MRKLIIALLTPVFYLIPTSSDAVNCANITTQTKCNKTIGCIWDISRCTAKTFLIKYNTGDGCFRMTNSTCTYGATNCTAPNVSSCTYSGYTFRGWSCDNCTTQTLISPGTQLSTLSNGQDIELTAQWQPSHTIFGFTILRFELKEREPGVKEQIELGHTNLE